MQVLALNCPAPPATALQVQAAQAKAKSHVAKEFVRMYNLQRASGMGVEVDPKVRRLGWGGWGGRGGGQSGGGAGRGAGQGAHGAAALSRLLAMQGVAPWVRLC